MRALPRLSLEAELLEYLLTSDNEPETAKEKYDVIEYIGIAADETDRITHKCNSRTNVRLPLVEWGMTEADCLKYCKDRGYDWGGLYEKFGRVSCWCCPLQPLNELRILYFDFPDLWKQLREWDNATWRTFKPGWSVRKLEARFDFELEWQSEGNQRKGISAKTPTRRRQHRKERPPRPYRQGTDCGG